MSNTSWAPTTPEAAARRAGGRRRYNAGRHEDMLLRRYRLANLLDEFGLDRGAQSRMAEELGVNRSTISRDIVAVLGSRTTACPTCSTRLTPEQWKGADRWEKAQWRS